MTTWTWRRLANLALGLSVLGALLGPGTPVLAAGRNCQDNLIAVALAPGLHKDQQVFTRLCLPEGPPPATVQVLVHGITYTHLYWDFPDPTGGTARYSYVNAALEAGFATLAMDRIGGGASSRPLGALVTIESNAYVVHQVIQALRAGAVRGPTGAIGFEKVVLVGHSYGSFTAWYEATDYQDVDGVILSGVSHTFQPTAPLNVLLPLRPAFLDPAFFGQGYDPTYLTTVPSSRQITFYAPGKADPAVIALDERTKSTLTLTEFSLFPLVLARPLDIQVPVLLANGSRDTLFCGPTLTPGGNLCADAQTLLALEAPRLGPRVPCAEAWVLPGAGHMLNTLLDAPQWFAVAQEWSTRLVGTGPGPAPGCAR
ncbi:alpha/beta hydrolase [Cystobacter fuscus]|uniref:alpha/beta hydrolase n=1 Tax=Cystobacter fuscus TaxID=43 RepID=UPI0037BF3AB8